MTLIFMDSFEHFDATGESLKWNSQATVFSSPSTTNGRTSGKKSMDLANSASLTRQLASSEEHATLIVGIAVRFAAFPSDNNSGIVIFKGDDHQTSHISFCIDSTGHIVIKRGTPSGTVIATSSAIATGLFVWHYYEFKVTLSDTVGLAECRVDGVTSAIVTFSGDTKNAGTDTVFDSVSVGTGMSVAAIADDFYLCNGAGSANNDYLGDCVVECLFPTSDGANTSFTPSTGVNHWATVDESPQNTSDYNSSSTLDQIDTYGMSDLVTAAGTVLGVQVSNYAQKDVVGSRKVAPVIRRSGTNYAGADKAVGVGFTYYSEIWEQDPSTAAAWAIAGVNAAEIGAKVR